MTFEEFFKKKKINLPALQTAEGPLFAEFKEHYEAMGEKSFDHTKKYWFNKLRRAYPLPPEVKAEKVVMENKMAEQTIADTLTDPATIPATPKPGFTPRFRAGAKPPEGSLAENAPPEEVAEQQPTTEKPAEASAAKPAGFTPRFKAGVTAAKPAEQAPAGSEPHQSSTPAEEKPAETAAKPAGFKPRFKAGVTASKPATEEQPASVEKPADTKPALPVEEKPAEAPEPATPKPTGFKPRFKAGVTKTSDTPPGQLDIEESATVTPEVNQAAAEQAEILKENPDAHINQVKPDFQREKEAAQEAYGSVERTPEKQSPEEFIDDKKTFTEEKQPGEDSTAPKLGFKPRFKPKG